MLPTSVKHLQQHLIPSSLFKSDAASLAYLFLGSFTHSSLQNLSSSISLDGDRHSRRFTEWSQSWFFVILAVYSRALWGRLSSGMSLYVAAFIFHSTLTRLTVPAAPQHNAATTVLPYRDGIVHMTSSAWVPPDMMSCIQVKEFNFCFIRAENFISHCLGVLQVTSGKLQVGCHEPFTEWLSSGHSIMQA